MARSPIQPTPRVPTTRSPSKVGTQSEPPSPVAFAPGRATPLASVCRLQSETGLPVAAASPAMPLPSGMRRLAARTGSGMPGLAATG